MRRLSTLATRLVALVLISLALGSLAGLGGGSPAGAQSASDGGPACDQAEARGPGRISVVTVSGLLDPVLARFMEQSITDAEDADAAWIVFVANSRGTVISPEETAELVVRVRTAEVPVAVWVGQSGSRVYEGMAQVAAASCRIGVSPGSRYGRLGEPVVDPEEYFSEPVQENLERLTDDAVGSETAEELGISVASAEVLGPFLIGLDGVETDVVRDAEGRDQTTVAGDSQPVFSKLSLMEQLLHTVSSPAVAYLLLLTGMALIVFELFTAGIGIAGVVGAGCAVLGCYGMAVLPARGWAVALLVLTVLAYAVDVQTGVPRVWTGIGTVFLVVGSLMLYDGLSLSWITLLVGIGGMLIFVIGAMPAMVRTRFSTPTIGRGWMIGEEGDAVTAIDPEGVVQVRGAPWRARTNRATPVPGGARVRVVEVDGLLLEVEPLEGAARDHRERRGADDEDDPA